MKNKVTVRIKARLILYHRGRILLLKQTRPNGGNYTLVGGNIDNDESAIECVIRESFEEAGIILKKKHLTLVHILQKTSTKEQRMVLYFKANKWQGEISSREEHKFEEAEWFDLEDLPPNLTGTVKHVLTQYRTGRLYSTLNEGK